MAEEAKGERKLRVLTIGFGALGALYSFLLERGGKAHVTALARSNYDAIVEKGITIDSQKYGKHSGYRPSKLVRSEQEAKEAGPYDYVLSTYKIVPDLRPTSDVLRPMLAPPADGSRGPVLIFIENGIGIEDEPYESLCVRERLASAVVSCCAWIGANLVEEGTRVEHGPVESLEMGLFPSKLENDAATDRWRKEALQRFAEAYREGEGVANVVDDVQPARWKKLLWNTAWGGLSTLSRQPVSVIVSDENWAYTFPVVRKIMLEVLFVARALGMDEERLPAGVVDAVFDFTADSSPHRVRQGTKKLTTLTDGFKPSLLLDLEAGRPMELEAIVHNVVQRARWHNVDTPRLDLMLAALRPAQRQSIARDRARRSDSTSQQPPTSSSEEQDLSRLPSGMPVD